LHWLAGRLLQPTSRQSIEKPGFFLQFMPT
jgi:hypothetical protein